ncbi:MAG TPA: Gfo/Idh/MocA family oxidoreductase [Syntrophorhabdaceae bacterium]
MSLRIALIGAGHMGRIHLQKLAAMDGVTVSGIADTDRVRAAELSEQYALPFVDDYHALLGNSDGVVVSTPTEAHYEIGRAFLAGGAHLFMEKPITSETSQARELIQLAKEKGLVFQVGHLERFNPAFTKAAALVKAPLYIETRRVSPFTGRSTDITVILDLMIHDIDLVLSLARSPVKEVKAQGMAFVSEKLDMVNARLEFENGCVANLTASRVASERERTVAVFEGRRYFCADLMEGRLTTASTDEKGGMETVVYEGLKGDAVNLELMEFMAAIRGEAKPSVTGEDGLNALVLADLIDQHIDKRRSI